MRMVGHVNAYTNPCPARYGSSLPEPLTQQKGHEVFMTARLGVAYYPRDAPNVIDLIRNAEALVRWEQPDRGMVLPADFILTAEDSNLIIEIGEWVLEKVYEDFRTWQLSVTSPSRVSVNLSLKQLYQINFINRISSIMRSHEVSPTSLEIEMTETTLMENPERTIKMLDQLYGLVLHLAIDDFGTGYSSLTRTTTAPN
jgi:EAL domain-containing protein (putative c-di-GMP-specific phosphodiesterase class I)